jgi:ESS family glutamate:Na+ symporter
MFDLVENWELMNFFVYLGVLLFIAKIIKEKLPFLNKVIIPSALIAGFIGLMLSDGFLNVINLSEPVYEVYDGDIQTIDVEDEERVLILTAAEVDDMNLVGFDIEEYNPNDDVILIQSETDTKRIDIIYDTVYHALAIGFIALTLRREKGQADKKVWSTGMVIVLSYLLQAVLGAAVVFFLFSDLFLGAGLLLPLGFGQGPGLATSIGNGYATGVGELVEGGALGATIASIGFLVGGVIGVIALNYLARKHKLEADRIHREESTIRETFEVETIQEIRVFDSFTMQLVIIFVIYGFVYLTLVALENYILPTMGDLGETFAGVFHGFNFLIGIVYALAYRRILKYAESKGKNVNFLTNNYVLSNISSLAFNFMIAGAVLTITIQAVQEYYLLVIVLATVGTIFTFLFLRWISHRIYKGQYEIHYFLSMFGMLTGTASTGLALLKGVDRDFESPIAEEIVVGSGTAISMALPLFALLMFPGLAITSGNNIYNVLVFVIPIAYGLLLLGLLLYINREKS